MTDILDNLKQHPFFEGFRLDHLEQICECASATSFEAGDYLVREGSEASHLFLIQSGSVSLETSAPTQNVETFQTLSDFDFVGVSWLCPPYRLIFDAVATTPVEAIVFDARCLRTHCESDHSLGYALMKLFVPALVERLTCARLKALDLYQVPA
ncbi:MAG: cyclic nucleotide-binding domain-containing protein [Henriciella sp.]|nr:cyclic nucleotide-binding domain-containing protein [Henriciella sp.]